MNAPLLEVEGLSVAFPTGSWPRTRSRRVVHEVSFTVGRGEIVALVGESGSGKSTIGRAVARLGPREGGRVRLGGEEVGAGTAAPRSFRRRVQLIFQDPFASLNPVHPVGHGVARALLLHGRAGPDTVEAEVARQLEAVGLSPGAEVARRHPFALSGGQRQRAAIARALAVGPELVIADEPTSMLDVSVRMEILGLFRRLRDEGKGVVLITHDLASARLVADRAIVLYAGRIVESGPAREVLSRPRHPYARLLLEASARTGLRSPPAPAARSGAPTDGGGCAFAPRCPLATPDCARTPPALLPLVPGHEVRCPHAPVP